MLSRTRWLFVSVGLAGWLLLVGPAVAVFPPPIKDEAKLFSPDGLDKANKKIKEIYRGARKDVVIETYAAPPEGKKVPDDPKKRLEFYREWADARIKELGVNGVYVVITMNPRFLFVRPDRITARKAFTGKDVKKLEQAFFKSFKEKKFDAGLLEGLDVIAAAYKANLGGK
jgi:hypothetical protein